MQMVSPGTEMKMRITNRENLESLNDDEVEDMETWKQIFADQQEEKV